MKRLYSKKGECSILALISPAKKLDFDSEWRKPHYTQPDFLSHSQELINSLKSLPSSRLQSLMKLSEKLGDLNYSRYQSFKTPFTPDNARPAIMAFRGDTYLGLDADSLSDDDILYTQDHLRMISGLYGLLRPLDLMQPYRLEMGTKLKNARGKDLYSFWGDVLANACNDHVQNHPDKSIICLASNEYIKAIPREGLKNNFITCHFKEQKNGELKTIGLFAKRARGMMARFMITERIETPDGLKDFHQDGYGFMPTLSDRQNYVFSRAGGD